MFSGPQPRIQAAPETSRSGGALIVRCRPRKGQYIGGDGVNIRLSLNGASMAWNYHGGTCRSQVPPSYSPTSALTACPDANRDRQ